MGHCKVSVTTQLMSCELQTFVIGGATPGMKK